MDTGYGEKRKEELGLSDHAVVCTAGELAARGSFFEDSRTQPNVGFASYSLNIFPSDYLKCFARAFGTQPYGLTFIIKIIVCELNWTA